MRIKDVMAGLDPAIHAKGETAQETEQDLHRTAYMDGRVKPGHDVGASGSVPVLEADWITPGAPGFLYFPLYYQETSHAAVRGGARLRG